MTIVTILMGVSGSGKTTLGLKLAEVLKCPFYDGDDYHPPENLTKMASGLPLEDEDRFPWLARLSAIVDRHVESGEPAVLACSALKKAYRDTLRHGHDGVMFIYLRGSFDTIWERMRRRQNHYMQAGMLRSQFQDLEEPSPQEALVIDVENDLDAVVSELIERLGLADDATRRRPAA